MLGMLFFGLIMICTMLVSKLYLESIKSQLKKKHDKDENGESKSENQLISKRLNVQLEKIFSLALIVDAKFIGLFNFLFSNMLTGCVNLLVNTLVVSHLIATLVISVYTFASFAIPLVLYRLINKF